MDLLPESKIQRIVIFHRLYFGSRIVHSSRTGNIWRVQLLRPHGCKSCSFTKHHFEIRNCQGVARDWLRIGQTIVISWLTDWPVTWIKNTKDCNISLRWIRSRVWLFSRTGNMWRVQLLSATFLQVLQLHSVSLFYLDNITISQMWIQRLSSI